jgi:PAS domain S-box-containing protein
VDTSSPNPKLTDFSKLLENSQHLGVVIATSSCITDANDAFLNMIGYSRQELEAGAINWRAMTPPEFSPLDERALAELRLFGTCVPAEKEYVLRDGTRLPILFGAVRISAEPLACACWIVNLRAQKEASHAAEQSRQLEAELAAELAGALRIHDINRRLLGKGSLPELFQEILDAAIEVAAADFGTMQLWDGDVLRMVAQCGFNRELLDYFAVMSEATCAACIAAVRRRSRVIVADVASDTLFQAEARDMLLRANVRAIVSTPLAGRSGKVYGVLTIHFRGSCCPTGTYCPEARALRYLDLLASEAADLMERLQYGEMERRAERLAASVAMANALAHEINNPLQALTNILALLSKQGSMNPDIQDLVQVAQQQVHRIDANVRAILAMDFGNSGAATREPLKLIENLRARQYETPGLNKQKAAD